MLRVVGGPGVGRRGRAARRAYPPSPLPVTARRADGRRFRRQSPARSRDGRLARPRQTSIATRGRILGETGCASTSSARTPDGPVTTEVRPMRRCARPAQRPPSSRSAGTGARRGRPRAPPPASRAPRRPLGRPSRSWPRSRPASARRVGVRVAARRAAARTRRTRGREQHEERERRTGPESPDRLAARAERGAAWARNALRRDRPPGTSLGTRRPGDCGRPRLSRRG
jgi:hypothetical protein